MRKSRARMQVMHSRVPRMESLMVVRGLRSGVCMLLACGNLRASPLYEPLLDNGTTGVVSTRSILYAGRASQLLKSESEAEAPLGSELAIAVNADADRSAASAPLTLNEFMDASSTDPLALVAGDLCTDAAMVAFCRERGLSGDFARPQSLSTAVVVDPEATLGYPGQDEFSNGATGASPGLNAYPAPGSVAQMPSGALEADPLYSQEPLVKEWAKRNGFLRVRDFLMENRYRLILALFGVYLVAITLNMVFRSVSGGGGAGGSARRRSTRRRR